MEVVVVVGRHLHEQPSALAADRRRLPQDRAGAARLDTSTSWRIECTVAPSDSRMSKRPAGSFRATFATSHAPRPALALAVPSANFLYTCSGRAGW